MGKRLLRSCFGGLRSRIALLSVIHAAPLLGLLVACTLFDRFEAERSAREQVLNLARYAATQQESLLAQAANAMHLMAQMPDVYNATPGACTSVLRRAANDDPWLNYIFVARQDGSIACVSDGSQPAFNVIDRPYFQRTLRAGQGSAPSIQVIESRHRKGEEAVTISVPGRSAVPTVITASLSFEHLFDAAAVLPAHLRWIATVFDPATGKELATARQYPDDGAVGPADPQLIAAIRQRPNGGTVAVVDSHGDWRVVGFAPLPIGDRPLFLTMSLSQTGVLAKAETRLYTGLAIAFVALILALGLAWSAARSMLLQPIEALADAASRLGSGDLSVRAGVPGAVTEVRTLAITFNRMARQLQFRQKLLTTTQEALQTSEEHHRLLAENTTDMITRFDKDFSRTYVSPASREMLGYTQEELVGRLPSEIVHPDDWGIMEADLHGPMRLGRAATATFRTQRKDGDYRWTEVSGRRLPNGAGYVVITRDVTPRKIIEQQLEEANRRLERLAMQDPLTGLANRRRLEELLHKEFHRSTRLRRPISLIMMDVDWFKAYNDAYGHPAGDACLRLIAGAVSAVLREPGDLVARIGGEEFAVLLPNTSLDDALAVAERVRQAVRDLELPHGGSPFAIVTISLGVETCLPTDQSMVESLLISAADKALYLAKSGGRDCVYGGESLAAAL
jgi:diguanylate cyclase (GGDEF)-like protein/PAS domain S-box-containing protein